jgi:hypothetical protein
MHPGGGFDVPAGLDALHPPVWDEQMGLTFTDTFTSLHMNVTAVAQADQYGYGPGYLLNGLTEKGFWYQVGVTWQWPMLSGGHNVGFAMAYEVFNSAQQSVFPNQGSGQDLFSGTVSSGDVVLLSLSFSGGNVTMAAYDWNSTASASESFTAVGASTFKGVNSTSSNGFFSGPMTEWWHAAPYYGGQNQTQYSDALSLKSSGWMWADEWAPDNGSSLFGVNHFASFSNATALQFLGFNGCQMAANASVYLTGGQFQAPTTISYSVVGGGAGASGPVITYWSNSTQVSANLSASSSVYMIDLNSVWSLNGSLLGSSGSEAWRTNQNTSYTVSVIKTYNFTYFHQFIETFGLNVVGNTGYQAFSVSVTQFGLAGLASMGSPVFVDAQSSFSYPNPLPGSGQTERWSTADSVTGFVTGPGSLKPTYYDQLSLSPSYSALGGAGTSVPPQLLSQRYGSSVSMSLTTSPVLTWLDRGAPWSAPITLSGGSAPERWQAAQLPQGTVSSPQGISLLYYHQYLVNASYSVASELPILPFPGWPLLTGSQFGAAMNATTSPGTGGLPPVWLDGGTTWNISGSTLYSSGTERVATNSTTSGVVGVGLSISPAYYDQFLFSVGYSVLGGGSPAGPSVNYSSFGTMLSVPLATASAGMWLDKGSSYSVSPILSATPNERWATVQQGTAGSASATTNLSLSYSHQFLVSVSTNYLGMSSSSAGGSVQPSDGWFDSGGVLTLQATPSSGWGFEGWQGSGPSSYSGNLTQTTIQVTSGIREVAVFYPSFTITVVGSGSVSYTSSGANGTVQGGQTRVLYLPPLEVVTLKAEPSAFFYRFESWGGTGSGAGATQVSSSLAPVTETATFGVDWVGSSAPVVLLALGIVLVLLMWRRRRMAPQQRPKQE